MTALTMPAQPGQHEGLRPVPRRRMAWVTWRQHRAALAGVAALFDVAAVYLLITGLQMHHAYAAVAACRPAGSGACRQVADNFLNTYAPGVGPVLGLLQVIPALIGAFAAAPVLARNWRPAPSATPGPRASAGPGGPSPSWYRSPSRSRSPPERSACSSPGYIQPIFGAGDDNGPLSPTLFDLRGVTLAAWTLAAFAIGALAGVLIRRVIPAMFATLAAAGGLAFATGAYLRHHYAAPLVTTNPNFKTPAWVISQVWTRGGSPASLSVINQTLHGIDTTAVTPGQFQPGPAAPASIDPVHYLIQHGYTLLTTYQPDSRFWPFQWIEGGWLLALSLLLIAATIWLVRPPRGLKRRTARNRKLQ